MDQRALQILRARRAAGAGSLADHALDHPHVAPAPEQKALVEFDQILEQQIQVVVRFGVRVDLRKLSISGAPASRREAAPREQRFDVIVERGRFERARVSAPAGRRPSGCARASRSGARRTETRSREIGSIEIRWPD